MKNRLTSKGAMASDYTIYPYEELHHAGDFYPAVQRLAEYENLGTVEELSKLKKSDASKEQSSIDYYCDYKKLKAENKELRQMTMGLMPNDNVYKVVFIRGQDREICYDDCCGTCDYYKNKNCTNIQNGRFGIIVKKVSDCRIGDFLRATPIYYDSAEKAEEVRKQLEAGK